MRTMIEPLTREQLPTHKPYKVTEKFLFNGQYRGVSFELQKWQFGSDPALMQRPDVKWCFYLFLTADQFDAETWKQLWLEPERDALRPERVRYNYYSSSLICNIDFHGGVTFYEKVGGIDGSRQCVKVGCDYGHHMDEAWHESVGSVLMDTERAVDSVYEAYPALKVWCRGNGKFFPASEGAFDADGGFTSNEYKAQREAEKNQVLA